MRRLKMIGSALSQVGNVMTAFDLDDTGPNESISARCWRQGLTRRRKLIDVAFRLLFNQHNHCENAHLSDVRDARALLKEVDGF